MSVNPRKYLHKARESAKAGDFEAALENYEYFFDHALDDDPHSFYGVRLSYCLNEWALLGRKFPKAYERLVAKKESSRRLLLETKDSELFHDFQSICQYLGQQEEPMGFFLFLHRSEPEIAASVVRYIWDQLVESENWIICSAYLGSVQSRYENMLQKYDKAMEVCRSEPSFGGEDFARQIKGWFVRDASNLLTVLCNTNQTELAEKIRAQINADTKERGCKYLCVEISRRAGL